MTNQNIIKHNIITHLQNLSFNGLNADEVENGEWLIYILDKINDYITCAHSRISKITNYYDKRVIAKDLIMETSLTASESGFAFRSRDLVASSKSFGINLPFKISRAFLKMVYITSLQVELICNLCILYQIEVDPEFPIPVLNVLELYYGVPPLSEESQLIKEHLYYLKIKLEFIIKSTASKTGYKLSKAVLKENLIRFIGLEINEKLLRKLNNHIETPGYNIIKHLGNRALQYCCLHRKNCEAIRQLKSL